MTDILHANIQELSEEVRSAHAPFGFCRKTFVPRTPGGKCMVSVYELPAGKSAYPYHWHTQSEEVFYILSGEGTLRTPSGQRSVRAGDFIYFPAAPEGAHRLTNTGSEKLVYIDFDTVSDISVTFYPDSGKTGVWYDGHNHVYKTDQTVDYYTDE